MAYLNSYIVFNAFTPDSCWLILDYTLCVFGTALTAPMLGVPDGSGCHSRERAHCVPAGEPALRVPQNRLPSQTSGDSSFSTVVLSWRYFGDIVLLWNGLNLPTLSSVLPLQHRCVAIFKDKQNKPTGFALGSIEGRVAIHYINPPNPWVSNANPKHHQADFEPFIIEKSPRQCTSLVLISDPFQSQRQLYL